MNDILYGVGGLIAGVGAMLLYALAIGKGAKAKAADILRDAQQSAKDATAFYILTYPFSHVRKSF